MYYMIDNYDSFVYNLSAYLEEAGQEVLVRSAGKVSLSEIYERKPEGIILSPGPGTPEKAAASRMVLCEFQDKIPILGVCLGHQTIGHVYGARVCKGSRPMHGKVTKVIHSGTGLFEGLPGQFPVTRYHSLVVSEKNFPHQLKICARAEDGTILGLSHRTMPIYGVQFHPEAVLTRYGHELLGNFHKICEKWGWCHAENKRA